MDKKWGINQSESVGREGMNTRLDKETFYRIATKMGNEVRTEAKGGDKLLEARTEGEDAGK